MRISDHHLFYTIQTSEPISLAIFVKYLLKTVATSSCLATTLLFDKIITLSLLLIDLLETSGFTVSQHS